MMADRKDKKSDKAEAAERASNDSAGEDEGSAAKEGDDSHLKEEQKPLDH
jgi:hypothetical protein